MKTLPDEPSDLIMLALADLRKCEQDPQYRIGMNAWHAPLDTEPVCVVCLAGAVMSKTLEASPEDHLAPESFQRISNDVWCRLVALDRFRVGACARAFEEMELPGGTGDLFERAITDYEDDPQVFFEDMETLAADLKEAGY